MAVLPVVVLSVEPVVDVTDVVLPDVDVAGVDVDTIKTQQAVAVAVAVAVKYRLELVNP